MQIPNSAPVKEFYYVNGYNYQHYVGDNAADAR